jgi:hypothetical protein
VQIPAEENRLDRFAQLGERLVSRMLEVVAGEALSEPAYAPMLADETHQ